MRQLLLKGYCASLFQGCTIISSGINLIFGLVLMAVGAIVVAGPFAHAVHCDTIGYIMMFGGVFVLLAGAFAMYSACFQKVWAARLALILSIFGLCALIGAAGYSSSVQSNIKTYTKEAFKAFKPQERNEFEHEHTCCGFDRVTEGSPGCPDQTPCGKAFIKMVQKYPAMATTISLIGAGVLMFALLMTLLMLNKMNAAKKKQERRDREHASGERPSRVHKTTKLGSRFGTAKALEAA